MPVGLSVSQSLHSSSASLPKIGKRERERGRDGPRKVGGGLRKRAKQRDTIYCFCFASEKDVICRKTIGTRLVEDN